MTLAADPVSLAPPFALLDSRGQLRSLADLLTAGPLIITFYRGHWCPYCRRYLTKLQANYPRILERGAALVAISPEPPATASHLARDLGLQFPLLCDVGGEVIDRYGTRNRLTGSRSILPHASVFILDASGGIRFRSIDRNYKRRTTMHTLFRQIDDLRNR